MSSQTVFFFFKKKPLHFKCECVAAQVKAASSEYLPEENAAVPAEVQGVPVLLLGWVVLLQGKIHQLPLDVALLGEDQVSTELNTEIPLRTRHAPSSASNIRASCPYNAGWAVARFVTCIKLEWLRSLRRDHTSRPVSEGHQAAAGDAGFRSGRTPTVHRVCITHIAN